MDFDSIPEAQEDVNQLPPPPVLPPAEETQFEVDNFTNANNNGFDQVYESIPEEQFQQPQDSMSFLPDPEPEPENDHLT